MFLSFLIGTTITPEDLRALADELEEVETKLRVQLKSGRDQKQAQ